MPAAVEGTITAAHPASVASIARATARPGSTSGTNATGGTTACRESRNRPWPCSESRTAGVEAILVLASEPCRSQGGEHQLALDPQEVEGPAPLHRIEGSHGVPSLVPQETPLGQLRLLRVRTPRLELRHRVSEHAVETIARHIAQPVLEFRFDKVVEEVGQLHDVAVGVQNAACSYIAVAVSIALTEPFPSRPDRNTTILRLLVSTCPRGAVVAQSRVGGVRLAGTFTFRPRYPAFVRYWNGSPSRSP